MEGRTYDSSEHRIGGLKTVGAFFPEKAILVEGGNIASDSTLSLGDNEIGGKVRVLGG